MPLSSSYSLVTCCSFFRADASTPPPPPPPPAPGAGRILEHIIYDKDARSVFRVESTRLKFGIPRCHPGPGEVTLSFPGDPDPIHARELSDDFTAYVLLVYKFRASGAAAAVSCQWFDLLVPG
jgi:hypothetical protein